MGCDFYWTADEPDLHLQRRAACFLEGFARGHRLAYVCYNGPVSGYFMDAHELRGARPEWATKHLVGVSIYDPEDLEMYGQADLGARQWSFVFDNSHDDRHPLITLEPIPNFESKRYSWLREYFDGTPMDPTQGFYAVYQERGYERMIGELSGGFASFLAALKTNWIPTLEVRDDYMCFEEAMSCPDEDSEFWSKTLDPNLEKRWQDSVSIGPIWVPRPARLQSE